MSGANGAVRAWDFHFFAERGFQFGADVFVFLQEDAGVFAALAHAFAAVADPGTGFFEDALVDAEVNQVAFAGNAFAVENVEFGFAEGSRDFVLYDFGAGARADDPVAVLDGLDAPNVNAHGSVKLKGAAAGGGFGIAEHDANFFPDLVDEDEAGFRFGDDCGEFAQCLRHQARLQSHGGIAHVAFEFGLGDESGDRVDDDDVDGVRTDEFLSDFESLFAVIGLRDQKVVHVYAEFAGIAGIERVFGVDESGLASEFLGFGDDLQRERGLTTGFRSVDFDDAAAGKTANSESGVNRKAAAGDDVDWNEDILAAEPHDGALAVKLLDDGDCGLEVLHFFVGHCAPQ